MKRILAAYKDLIGIIFAEAPVMVVITFVCTIISGLLTPLGVYINQNVFDGGLAVARGEMTFSDYSVFLVLFVIAAILPSLIIGLVNNYVEPRSLLILRTVYKARMLKKLKTMKYEHFEHEASAEIIDKAYNRAEHSARHLWPMYVMWRGAALIASIGTLAYVFSIRWWLLLTVLIPFVLETYISSKTNYNIYNELETYWKRERKYSTLGGYLRSRNFSKELKVYGNYDYLIDTYRDRLNERNRDYERYYFKNIRKILLGGNITKIGAIINVIIMLMLFVTNQISVGLFIAMTSLMFGGIYLNLESVAGFFKWSGYHVNSYDFYDKFFGLSDEAKGTQVDLPTSFDIEFRDVWFKYPGTDKDILKGLTFKIKDGEKASIVGENGEGKSTMIKLLLGLFSPDKGEILVGGKNLDEYPLAVRTKIFAPIFQDFPRYSITLKENIGIGNIDEIGNEEKIKMAAMKGKADKFAEKFEKSYDTLLGRDFEGGVDISGGQWQRIAIARAFMGDKPVLLLDEPTSQLDPMAEANLYNEFAGMVENKTAIFITHRLGSTMITDRIFVIYDGKIKENGTHDELMKTDGIYATMFSAQKQWYKEVIVDV
ncbi:MAG: ABC transporter ATP-binding protein/permease [Lachnospiraceae bacterium]|jgi:ATP-binding cassette subfamily B protein|nr:ABC transporter ATP-binding protein/permease [Lachnospiraceae bacterium]